MTLFFRFHLVFLLLLFYVNSSKAQSYFYKITILGSKYSSEDLSTAVSKADWCGYFHVDSAFTITFDDGSVVILKNKAQLSQENILFNDGCFQNDSTKDLAIYSIHSSGVLMRRVEKDAHFKSTKY